MAKRVVFAEYNTEHCIPSIPGTHKMNFLTPAHTTFSKAELRKEIVTRRRSELRRLEKEISEFDRELDDIVCKYDNFDDSDDDDEELEILADRLTEISVLMANCHLKLSLIKSKCL